MSLLSSPLVADTLARVFAVTVRPAAKPAVSFPAIRARTSETAIPTRHGSLTATV